MWWVLIASPQSFHTAKLQIDNVSDKTIFPLHVFVRLNTNVTLEGGDIHKMCRALPWIVLQKKKKGITKDRKKERKMLPSGAWPIYGCQNAKIRTVSKKEKEKKNTESRSRDLQYSIGFRSTGITEHKPKLNRHRIKEAPSCSSSWLQKRQREEMLHKAETQQSHKIQLSSLYREGVETFLGLETQARKAKKIKNKIL